MQLPCKFTWKLVQVDLLKWKFSWKLVEEDLLPWKLVEASMEIHGRFWLSVEVEASIASINCSFHVHSPWKLPRASIYPYILSPTSTSITNFQLLPQDFHKSPPCSVRYNSMEVGGNFHGNFHGSLFTSMEAFMEVDGRVFSSTSMKVSGSFLGSTWKFLLSVEVETSIASINCIFHE